jgi:hypothetical protein
MTPANALASAPSISLASGKYISQQNVTLSSTTPGSTVYYTTDGTTPSDASTPYSSTFSVNSSMIIKAITYAVGYDASLLSMGTYTFPTNISTIALLKGADITGFYKLTGEAVLTFQQAASTYAKPKFVQDATGGILIFDSNSKITTTYNLYDGITGLIGTLSPYNGMVEFVPFTDPGVKTSSANTVQIPTVTLDQLTNYSGQLVKVLGVSVSDLATGGTGKFVATKDFPLTVGSLTGNLTTYTAADQNFIATSLPTVPQDITGVVLINLTAKLVPRSSADFTPTIVNGLRNSSNSNLKITTLKGSVQFTGVEGETVTIYNSLGQKLVNRQVVEGINTIPVNAQGVVLVKVGNRIAKVIL